MSAPLLRLMFHAAEHLRELAAEQLAELQRCA